MRRECRERFPRHRLQRKPLGSDPGMHHGTCGTHVPWCMSGSLTRCGGENVPGIPGACATRDFTYLVRGPWLVKWVTLTSSLQWPGRCSAPSPCHKQCYYFAHRTWSRNLGGIRKNILWFLFKKMYLKMAAENVDHFAHASVCWFVNPDEYTDTRCMV